MSAVNKLTFEEPRLGEGIYTSADVADILKIKKTRARYLIKQYLDDKLKIQQGFKYKMDINGNYAINFHALIELFVFERLRKCKVSSHKIMKFHDYLSNIFESPYPFAMTDFLVNGKNLYFSKNEKWVTGDGKLQIAFTEIVEYLGEKIKYDDESKLATQYYPLGKSRSIVVDPEYRFGQPILKDTSLMVENLYDLYVAEEKNLKYVAELYNITDQQMKDVIEFSEAA